MSFMNIDEDYLFAEPDLSCSDLHDAWIHLGRLRIPFVEAGLVPQ